MPAAPAFACPRCRRELSHEQLADGSQRCRFCGGAFEARRFDPPGLRVEAADGLAALPEAVACAAHERNAAVAACGRCGAFICALCRIEADGGGWCPACYERLSAEGALASARTQMRNWSGMSGICLVGSILFWPIGPLLAPLGVYYAIRGFKAQDQNRVGLALRGLLNALAFVGVAILWGAMFAGAIT